MNLKLYNHLQRVIYLLLLTGCFELHSVTYTATGCPANWGGFAAGTSPFYNGGVQLTSQPAAGSILIIPAGCTITVNANLSVSNNITLEIYGQLAFATTSDKLNLTDGSQINVYAGGSINGGSSSNQIKIGSGGAEWSGPGVSSGPFVITNGSSTLPIELNTFKAYCSEKKAILNWTTLSEKNNNYFEVRRSLNGLDWTVLTQIKGAGTKSTASDYTFEDQTFLHVNTYYYQLKQVDYDNSQSYSPIISVSCLSKGIVNMSLFPNPASDNLSIKISCFTENAKGKLSLINSCGSEVYLLELNLMQGMNLFTLPLSLPDGLYTVRLNIQDLYFQSVKQVIVN